MKEQLIKMVSNLPLKSFAKTKHRLLISTSVGNFFLIGDNWAPPALANDDNENETPVFRVKEFLTLLASLNGAKKETKIKTLEKVLKLKKEFNGRIIK